MHTCTPVIGLFAREIGLFVNSPPHHPFQGRVSIKFCIVFKNYVVIKTSLKPSEMQYLRGKTSSQKIEIFTLTEPHVEKSNSKSIFKNVKLDKSRFGHL